jgi:hypothetical protein
MNRERNRVLGRLGARELTPEEVARVSGGTRTFSATTNVVSSVVAGGPDTPETDDIDL